MSRSPIAWALAIFSASAAGQVALPFFDGFETGTVITTDVPPGRWEGTFSVGSNTISAADAGAHRGAFGTRAADNMTTDVGQVAARLQLAIARTPGDRYLRQWVRIAPSTAAGMFYLGQLYDGVVGGSVCAFLLRYPSAELGLAANQIGGGGFFEQDAGAFMTAGAWRLLECGVLDAGTASTQLVFWVDGVERVRETVDQSAWFTAVVQVGETWTNDGSFLGAIDVDDVAITSTPPPSRLRIDAGAGTLIAGTCTPIEIQVGSSSGASVATLHPETLTVNLSGVAATAYSDSACSSTAPSVIGAGQSAHVLWLRSDAGALSIALQSGDLIGDVVAFTVVPNGPLELQVGCGCGVAAAPMAFLFLALVMHATKRTRRV